MQVQSLNQEDPLEEGMATHSSILAWRITWTEEPGRLQPSERQNDPPLLGSLQLGNSCMAWRTIPGPLPSAQRLVWAAKQPLGNAALGALFA